MSSRLKAGLTRRGALPTALLAAALMLSGVGSSTTAQAQQASPSQAASADEAQTIAQEAYVYLYPLVLMDLTRKQLTNLDAKVNPMGGPANAFTNIRTFPTAEMRTVVRPNFDTL